MVSVTPSALLYPTKGVSAFVSSFITVTFGFSFGFPVGVPRTDFPLDLSRTLPLSHFLGISTILLH